LFALERSGDQLRALADIRQSRGHGTGARHMARLLPLLGLLRAPAAAPGRPAQRLRIRNGCESEPLWLARMAAVGDSEPPGPVRLEPGEGRLFDTPADLK
ncbi:unnamed protein product, partial [Prorocentrum cordatum]